MIHCDWAIRIGEERLLGWDTADLLVGRTFDRMRFTSEDLDLKVAFDEDVVLYVITVDHLRAWNYSLRLEDRTWGINGDREVSLPD